MSNWGHLGSQGSKGHFHKNTITCPCCIALPYDSFMCISLRLSIYVMGSNVKLGHLGSQGSKGHLHQKCCNSSILSSLTIRLMEIQCVLEKRKPRFKGKIHGHGELVFKKYPSNLINYFHLFPMIPFTPMLLMWMTSYRWSHKLLL